MHAALGPDGIWYLVWRERGYDWGATRAGGFDVDQTWDLEPVGQFSIRRDAELLAEWWRLETSPRFRIATATSSI